MKPIRLSPQNEEQIKALDDLYRHSKDGRLRQRAQIVLLAAEQGMVAPQIGVIVRLNEEVCGAGLNAMKRRGLKD